jgi:hypothetical protein
MVVSCDIIYTDSKKDFPPRLDGYRDRSYLPLHFFFVNFPTLPLCLFEQ